MKVADLERLIAARGLKFGVIKPRTTGATSMFDIKVTLKTPEFDGDDDIIYDITGLPSKKETRKFERQMERLVNQLGRLTDDELSNGKKAIPKGKNPTLLVAEYVITKDGERWSGGGQWWANMGDVGRGYLAGALHDAMIACGHDDKRKTVKRGKGANA